MLEKIRKLYKDKLAAKIVIVAIVVLLSVAIFLPIIKIAELFGINLRENAGLNFKVTFSNVFFFFLLGTSSITIIWLAQKYIHKKSLSELGLKRKILLPSIIGFIVGAIFVSLGYLIVMLNAESVKFINVIPKDVSAITYFGYYIYFFIGFIFWNSFIEEFGTRAYPIQKLKKYINPHIIFTIMGLIFTVGHFFLRDFNLGYFLSLFMFSYMLSLVYYYSNSIWLVVGIHSGNNWVGFSFMGTSSNWKLGTLYNTEISGVSSWVANYSGVIVLFIFILLIVFLNKKDFFRKYFPISNEASDKLE
jgi:membrane protease YdiL (CAAX protease family)